MARYKLTYEIIVDSKDGYEPTCVVKTALEVPPATRVGCITNYTLLDFREMKDEK